MYGWLGWGSCTWIEGKRMSESSSGTKNRVAMNIDQQRRWRQSSLYVSSIAAKSHTPSRTSAPARSSPCVWSLAPHTSTVCSGSVGAVPSSDHSPWS